MTDDFKRGVRAAADVADGYNGSTTHPYRLGDCVAGKLNVGRARPRLNAKALESPSDAMVRGICLVLAQMHRHGRCNGADVREVAADAAVTIETARRAGVERFDWRELERAGVPAGTGGR